LDAMADSPYSYSLMFLSVNIGLLSLGLMSDTVVGTVFYGSCALFWSIGNWWYTERHEYNI